MKVAITGASGLVGTALAQSLKSEGHEVFSLVRRDASAPNEIKWEPATGKIDEARMSEMDSVVHLAGESIANKRWTDEQKKIIRNSRVDATYKLAQTLASMSKRPSAFVCASAIGFYGDRGDETLTEDSARGAGFLAQLCEDWEKSTQPLVDAGVRVVHARISMVLGKNGGALQKLLPIFKMGAGGPIGNGKQYMSWVELSDLARALSFAATNENVRGIVNMTAPNPVTNNDFTRALGAAVHRPAFFPVPPLALRIAMGEVADELLLVSQKVVPTVLPKQGFQFKYDNIDTALQHVVSS